jgi:nitroimidazol reductase NimA-like FMN-containing flavoprotein (pyridoxamine 5'-phosphate oxidase superfamily)
MTQTEREEFLAETRVAVVSVTGEDGRPPLAVPVWYGYEPGGNLSFFTGTQGRRARKSELIDRAGVLTLSVQHGEVPYRYVTVEGTVVNASRPPSPEQMLAVARRYLPEQYAQGFVEEELGRADSHLVLYEVRPDRWLTNDFTDDTG